MPSLGTAGAAANNGRPVPPETATQGGPDLAVQLLRDGTKFILQIPEQPQAAWVRNTVIDLQPLLAPVDNPFGAQLGKMLRHRRRAEVRHRTQLSHGRFSGDQATQDQQPAIIGNVLQEARRLFGLLLQRCKAGVLSGWHQKVL